MLDKLVIEINNGADGIQPQVLHENNVQMVLIKADESFARIGRTLTDWGIPISAIHQINPSQDAAQQTAHTLNVIQYSRLPVLAVFPHFDQNGTEKRFSEEYLSVHAKKIFDGFRAAGCKTIGYTKTQYIANQARKAAEWLPYYQWTLGDFSGKSQTTSWDDIKAQPAALPENLPPRLNPNHIVGVQHTESPLTLSGIYTDKQHTAFSSIHAHWFDENFLLTLGASPNPLAAPQEPTEPDNDIDLKGVSYFATQRFDTNCHLIICSMMGMRFHVTTAERRRTVSQAALETGAQIVVNGDGWGTGWRIPNSIAASDGVVYQPYQQDYNPWMNISKDNKVSFHWRNPENLYNAVSGDRFLIQNGKYNEMITNVTKAPRTAAGSTYDGRLVILVADGRTRESAGLTFREVASIFLELGVTTAINLDGGGSTALWLKDRIANVPIDSGIPGKERAVANHLCIFIED